ncbi:MAG: alpha/beta hydrolase [Pseudorhodoplanes sp.]|nr:alpha/beta hydrolase [Pseudorhodoplanes sp.]
MSEQPDLGFIHRFVPARDERRKPLLLLHGTGGDENDLLPLGQRLSAAAALLSPRGKVLESGMPRFFKRVAEGEWDLEDLDTRTAELAHFVADARKAYNLPAPIALGFSNGANIAWSLMLREPALLGGAILMRAMLPFDPRPLPDLDRVPVLILAGVNDPLVPVDQAALLAALLGEAGADVTYEVVQGGHGLTGDDLLLAGSWLSKHG